ncbi:MAG: hypothetical protein R2784_13360 [Saprospiraceae bacterium]
MKSDLVEMLEAVANGSLKSYQLEIEPQTAATVFMVSGGYPEAYAKGKEITNLEAVEGSLVFHAEGPNGRMEKCLPVVDL